MKCKSFVLPFFAVILILLAAITSFSGCSGNTGRNLPSSSPAQDIGEGNTVFRFEVTDDAQTVTSWNVHTNEMTVGAALLETGLISGDTSGFGLLVKEVNGITADYDVNQSWWAFYVDGEMAAAGVDSTDIEPGKTYAFIFTQE